MKKIVILASSLLASLSLCAGQVHHIQTEQEFNNLLAQGKPVLLFLTIENCGPCKVMKPVFNRMAQERDDVIFISVQDEKQPQLAGILRRRFKAPNSPYIAIFNAQGKFISEVRGGVATENEARADLLQMIADAKGQSKYMTPPAPMPSGAPTKSSHHKVGSMQPQQPIKNGNGKTPAQKPAQKERGMTLKCKVIKEE